MGGQGLRNGQADAARGSGDQGGLIVEASSRWSGPHELILQNPKQNQSQRQDQSQKRRTGVSVPHGLCHALACPHSCLCKGCRDKGGATGQISNSPLAKLRSDSVYTLRDTGIQTLKSEASYEYSYWTMAQQA
jgi:hypothetical protein